MGQGCRSRRGQPPARTLAWRELGSIPFECAFLPFIGKADREYGQKYKHRPEPGRAEFPERHGPRKQEGYFQDEEDEEDGDQVEADVELHAGVVEGVEAALIGRQLFRIGLLEGHHERSDQEHQADQASHGDKDHQWKVILQDTGHREGPFPAAIGGSADSQRLELFRGLAQRTKRRKTSYLDALPGPTTRGKPSLGLKPAVQISRSKFADRACGRQLSENRRETGTKPFCGADETGRKQTKGTQGTNRRRPKTPRRLP